MIYTTSLTTSVTTSHIGVTVCNPTMYEVYLPESVSHNKIPLIYVHFHHEDSNQIKGTESADFVILSDEERRLCMMVACWVKTGNEL